MVFMKKATNRQQIASRSPSGFSLLEMLISLAVLGIMTSLALSIFGGASEGAKEQKNKRNAQEIASIAAVANAAGAQFVVPGDERATIENLRNGCSPGRGAFKGRKFQLPNLDEPAITGAMRYLALNDAELHYDPTASP